MLNKLKRGIITTMTREYELRQVYFDNLRSMGNISPEVAEDIGYSPSPEASQAAIESAKAVAALSETAKQVGGVICGDCAQVIPCDHFEPDPRRKGHYRSVGY